MCPVPLDILGVVILCLLSDRSSSKPSRETRGRRFPYVHVVKFDFQSLKPVQEARLPLPSAAEKQHCHTEASSQRPRQRVRPHLRVRAILPPSLHPPIVHSVCLPLCVRSRASSRNASRFPASRPHTPKPRFGSGWSATGRRSKHTILL